MFPFAAQRSSASPGATSADAVALHARAPQLREASERVLAMLLKSLQRMAGSPMAVKASVYDLALREMRDVASSHGPGSVAAMIKCVAVPCHLLATIDATFVHGIVDLLAGGGGRETLPAAPREATAIDQQFAHIAFTQLAGALEAEWASFGIGAASASRLDVVVPDLFGPRIKDVGCADFSISIFGVTGFLRLALPPIALDLFASGEPADAIEASSADTSWSNQFRREVGGAMVRVDAYLEGRNVDLASLARLGVGQIIALPSESRSRATLIAQGQPLFRGEIGQSDQRYTLRISDVVSDARHAGLASSSIKSDLLKA